LHWCERSAKGVLRAAGLARFKGERSEAKRNKWKGPACGEWPFMPDSLYP
jgi:hypothetical protein